MWTRIARRSRRRGSYSILFGIMIVSILGFGALAVDVSWVRLAQSQAQDVADAASQAALIELRRTGSADAAELAAEAVVARNTVAGEPPLLLGFDVGTWDEGAYAVSGVDRNAVRVVVGRKMDMLLAPIFGWFESDVRGEAISAARTLHVVLAVDITNSWSQDDFSGAREAAVRFFDVVAGAHGPKDKIGMAVFTGRYGVAHTSLRFVNDAVVDGTRDDWVALRTASKAGIPDPSDGGDGCDLYGNNNFSYPFNGCFPNMWREYLDEAGTDHAVGLEMAKAMFEANPDPTAYRALLLLTDGNPNGVAAHEQREDAGYVETRWDWIMADEARGTSEVIEDSQALAAELHLGSEIDIWAVSFVADAEWMLDVAQGAGYYARTDDPDALMPIFEDIAESLPLAIVR